MKSSPIFSLLAALAVLARADRDAEKPAAFFLAGDSTTAIQIPVNGGGWGNGFLGTLVNGAWGINYGHNGATTVSFVAGGDWATVLSSVRNATNSTAYVTISFGHNDQKAAANISVAEYMSNLAAMGTDVRNAGGEPIFVTSVSRRNYDTTTNLVIEDLSVQAAAMKVAAHSINATMVDLNGASTDYLNYIGPTDGHAYNLNPDDFTHLSSSGSILFGNIVSMLLSKTVDARNFTPWSKPNVTIATDITDGVFIFPSV